MKIDVAARFSPAVDGIAADFIAAAEGAINDTLPDTKQELRDQVVGAGLGQRLGKTWQGRAYANSGSSAGPAGFIWSKAPAIIQAFAKGATIRPVNGGNYLWIPTKNVPRRRGGRMSPEEVEGRFNTDFEIRPGRAGTLLAFIDVVRSLNARNSRAKGRRQARARAPLLMFVLRRGVHLAKLLDLTGPADRWADRYETAFDRRLGGT